MQIQRPLAVITTGVDGDVLAVLAGADRPFSVPQIVERAGRWSAPGVRKSAARLVEQGVVLVEESSRGAMYRLNRQHLAADPIIALATVRATFFQWVEQHIDELLGVNARHLEYACVFGSAATGQMRPDSDIDIFLVRADVTPAQQASLDVVWHPYFIPMLERDITARTGNDARVLEMSRAEVVEGLRNSDPILESIQRDGVRVGGAREFWSGLRRSEGRHG